MTDAMVMTLLGSFFGLFVLFCVAVVLGRMNDIHDKRCQCDGDCRQGRDCPARR